jgi:hypothetical protein
VFRLPGIVQYDSEETRALLQALPYCGGKPASWEAQRAYKCVISMDGNGATCSRVATSLLSNCVLLKYASPHMLYYFDGLAPWTHFIPIERHDDVLSAVALERHAPGILAPIAAAGRDFAETYLSRDRVIFYTAAVLTLYARCFTTGNATARRPDVSWPTERAMSIAAHVKEHGDLFATGCNWAGIARSGQWIEGFSISAGSGLLDTALRYRAVLADGTLGPWVEGGAFCGSRGRSQHLAGLCCELQGPDAAMFELRLEAQFTDGSLVGPVQHGKICAAASLAPLEAFRLVLTRLKP